MSTIIENKNVQIGSANRQPVICKINIFIRMLPVYKSLTTILCQGLYYEDAGKFRCFLATDEETGTFQIRRPHSKARNLPINF